MSDIGDALKISAAGMRVQSARIRVIAQNMANQDSTAQTAGGDPYRRKTITFKQQVDKGSGLSLVDVGKIQTDPGDFSTRYNPGHPAADKDGYVKMPNVNPLIEMADMREAQRSYEANLSAIETSRDMMSRTIDLLRN
jgi:flagellar basal-body rod protein FlgC